MVRVRFPLPAPNTVLVESGSKLTNPNKLAKCEFCRLSFAHIAQSVEHFLGKEEVTGSNPVMSSKLAK